MPFTVRCHQTYYRVFGKLSCGFCVCVCLLFALFDLETGCCYLKNGVREKDAMWQSSPSGWVVREREHYKENVF